MIYFLLFFRKLFGQFYFLSAAFLPGLCASICAILVERKSRYEHHHHHYYYYYYYYYYVGEVI